ncbi:acyltransferase [Streptococcus suis]|uniref:Maltose O-acetyltransferase n=1 Tax=Streptococcus suis TaxID=1307 RepID=A0A0F6S322_STRSU|nr:acyltransferase [Streptococcus suis]AKE79104.1 maltose O-acetyltransferase [Streptococcus suis]AKE79757.1 maltose O-acetyltransferase [Streptococcus suis]AKE80732.1 maltose O-acetyltransferase [Streptococcus suis]AKE80754.1 maltose O-acetyltransferase [Streptococcus suis]AKE80776.1 maltose O-acetyltransferase [Streptococcus suis]
MNSQIGYVFAKILSKIKREKHKETINRWFVKQGVELRKGETGWINICSNIAKNEPHLISIGNNTTIGGEVEFVTHDNSVSKVISGTSDLFGKIYIGENCFIGARSVILYGVTIADNVIVAAGSVVTKSIDESNVIVAGNPAKIVSTWERYAEKYKDYAWSLNEVTRKEMIRQTSDGVNLVKR